MYKSSSLDFCLEKREKSFNGFVSDRISPITPPPGGSILKSRVCCILFEMNKRLQAQFWGGGGDGGLVAKSCLTPVTPWTVACQATLSKGFSVQGILQARILEWTAVSGV